jgi:uncharacterized protein
VNPFFFGNSARQLFGAYESPTEPPRSDGVVLCSPFGEEYLLAHSAYRLLARQLSHAGSHTLRFDYFGTGDSAGEFEDADQNQWLSDIGTAINELRDVGQVSRISLVGLRYGAALAAMAAKKHGGVDRLVLWDPVIDGPEYLAGIGLNSASPDATVDVRGVGLTPLVRRQIGDVSAESFAPPLPRTLVISTTDVADSTMAFTRHLVEHGVDAEFDHVPDVAAWHGAEIGAAAMPVKALRKIVAWLT